MAKFVIKGKKRLSGVLEVNGAKNAALPILAATLMVEGVFILHNIPDLKDVETMLKLLKSLGLKVEKLDKHSYKIANRGITSIEAPYDLVKEMRASFLVMGPLLASQKKARVSLPGGCAIGARPVNLHLAGFEKLGVNIIVDHGFVSAEAKELIGNEIEFPQKTVTGTENVVMAAVMAKGRTIIANAALEPEVVDLCKMLNKMGAKISGAGTDTIEIEAVEKLRACEYTIIPDRVEAGTFIILSAISGGKIEVKNVAWEHLPAFKLKLEEMGIKFFDNDGRVKAQAPAELKPIEVITEPFPGFPTDLQAQLMVLLCLAQGQSKIKETIFENRFMHVDELNRLGAKIRVEGNTALIDGPVKFTGAEVKVTDLRAGASLVLAGLIAENTTVIDEIEHIERGYEDLVGRLRKVGAEIEKS